MKKLKTLIACFFISLFFNIAPINATENNNKVEKVALIKKKKKKTIIEDGIIKQVDYDYQIKQGKPRKIGGILTGTTFEKYNNSCLKWMEEFAKKNGLISPEIKIGNSEIIDKMVKPYLRIQLEIFENIPKAYTEIKFENFAEKWKN